MGGEVALWVPRGARILEGARAEPGWVSKDVAFVTLSWRKKA
jgi:hypothetical protein